MMNDLASVPAADLARELQIRGWDVRFRVVKPPDQSERNTAPEETWLEIDRCLSSASYAVLDANRLEYVFMALSKLYMLLEPPSVRERRLNGE